ncbi:MAG: hypothetical protein ABSE20_25975 [Acetobacteraceae bacterium]|jgi:hypothetical protein
MTHPSWPTRPLTRKRVGNPLPQSLLHQMVADLPGPRDETDTARAARFEAQLAEVLSYNPRNVAEVMLATHCILLRLVADDARRDANRAGADPAMARQHQRSAKQFDKLVANNRRMLADFQSRPLRTSDPAIFAALGLNEFLVPHPARSRDDAEEAFSAVIVPLHPAPKTLQ